MRSNLSLSESSVLHIGVRPRCTVYFISLLFPSELFYVSKLMLLPNLAYSATFSCCNSSLNPSFFSSSFETSSSSCPVEVERSSCTSDSGREINESPILYLNIEMDDPAVKGKRVRRALYIVFQSGVINFVVGVTSDQPKKKKRWDLRN